MAKGTNKDKPKMAVPTPTDKPFKHGEDLVPAGLGNALNSKVLLSLGPVQLTRYEAFEILCKIIVALVIYFVILRPKGEAPVSEPKDGL
jgi:hypothetical protein